MWRRLVQRPMGQFSQRSFHTMQYQSQQWTRRFMTRPYTAPVTIGFLGWLFGGVDYNAVKKDIAEILEDYDWDDC